MSVGGGWLKKKRPSCPERATAQAIPASSTTPPHGWRSTPPSRRSGSCCGWPGRRLGASSPFFFSSRRRHTRFSRDWSSDVCSSDPAAPDVRDFLGWAADHRHARRLTVPPRGRHDGPATSPDQRWALLARLLHDDPLEMTDRVAGALLLCYGQQLSRITTITRDQVTRHDDGSVHLRLGRDEITVPEPLAGLLTDLLTQGRDYVGVGTPSPTPWLFPGLLPGRPLTAARLGQRLRALGVYAQAGRRATLTQLAATLPAAVLADLLQIAPTTAVHWVHQAGGDWTRYAAELTRERVHQP